MYEDTKDESIKTKEVEAFSKANDLKGVSDRGWKKMNTTALFFAFIFLLLVSGAVGVIVLILHNILIKKEEKVNEAWAQTGALRQRKLDFIPALLEAVKTYAQHESRIQQTVIQARTKAQDIIEVIGGIGLSKEKAEEFLKSQEHVSLGLGKVFALAEKYPELKANINFLTMQEQLQETEEDIARARGVYNKWVRAYNAALRYFPSNLIAALLQFGHKEYFNPDDFARPAGKAN